MGTPPYLWVPHKMHLPLSQDLIEMIKKEDRKYYLYCCARPYWQLLLHPVDWPLMCIKAGSKYFMDVSLPFSLKWVAACCQDVTSLIVRDLVSKGLKFISYIEDFSRVAGSEQETQQPLDLLHATLT